MQYPGEDKHSGQRLIATGMKGAGLVQRPLLAAQGGRLAAQGGVSRMGQDGPQENSSTLAGFGSSKEFTRHA